MMLYCDKLLDGYNSLIELDGNGRAMMMDVGVLRLAPGMAFDFDEAEKETALMVGDSLTSDIRGGKNAGIRTCWFAPQGQPSRPDIRPDYRICALEELPALLETL